MHGKTSQRSSLRRSVALVTIGFIVFGLALLLRSSGGPWPAMRGPFSFFRLLEFLGVAVLVVAVARGIYCVCRHIVRRFRKQL